MKSFTENTAIDIKELNGLINSLRPYEFVFKRDAKFRPETIVIKLNATETKIVIITPNNNEQEIENDSQIFDNSTYTDIRTALHDIYRKLEESDLRKSVFKEAQKQILIYLKKSNLLEDREGFLVAFNDFLNTLPEVSPELLGYLKELASLKLDDVDIDSVDENDPDLKKLGKLHKHILSHLSSYRNKGEEYL